MLDPFSLALIGGGLGALTSKKPLKGALMGAGMGYGGGLLGAAMPQSMGALSNAQIYGQMGEVGGMASPGLLGQVSQYAKPVGQAFGAAQQVAGMFPEEQAPPPPQLMPQQGAGILAQLANQPMPQSPMEAERMMRRQQRRGLL